MASISLLFMAVVFSGSSLPIEANVSMSRTPPKPLAPSPTPSSSVPLESPGLGCGKIPYCIYKDLFGKKLQDRCRKLPWTCPANDCNVVNGTYSGVGIVKTDVNSFEYDGGPDKGGPLVATAIQCCDACKKDKKCNVWAFCGESSCGKRNECKRLYKKYPYKLDDQKNSKTGMYTANCNKDGTFRAYSCILQAYSMSDFKNAGSKLRINNNFISGTIQK